MTITASILADSVNPRGVRVTTYLLVYPRIVHAEHLRHRTQSFSVQSSRAVPFRKMVQAVTDDPALPLVWGTEKSGMSAGPPLPDLPCYMYSLDGQPLQYPHLSQGWARKHHLRARDYAVEQASILNAEGKGLHKQHATRILEPWAHVTVACTATTWDNFYELRLAPAAMPEMQALARAMLDAQRASIPIYRTAPSAPGLGCLNLDPDSWHLPFITAEERKAWPTRDLVYMSTGRCARVSYLTYEGGRDPEGAIHRGQECVRLKHWSALEHQCYPISEGENPRHSGNFYDWVQHRKAYEDEHPRRMWTTPYQGPVQKPTGEILSMHADRLDIERPRVWLTKRSDS